MLFLVDPMENELPEDALIRDLLFVFQGIDGKYLTMRKSSEGFRLADEVLCIWYFILISGCGL